MGHDPLPVTNESEWIEFQITSNLKEDMILWSARSKYGKK